MAGTLGISSATRKKAAGGGQSLSGTQQRTTVGNLMSTAEKLAFWQAGSGKSPCFWNPIVALFI